MSRLDAWLDATPGETRGIIARDGRYERLILHRDDDPPEHRLGARLVGRAADVEPALNGAFVDLGGEPPFGFLPLKGGAKITKGQAIEVEVTAEPRERKGPTLRLVGPAEGEARLLAPGPDVAARLAALAPGVVPMEGVEAVQASWSAEEEALADGEVFAEQGVDLAVERTRALIAVDIDLAPLPGRDGRRSRARANLFGIHQAARLIRLKGWGGLVAIDLAGTGHDGEAITRAARAAFAPDGEVAVGPVSRFGVLQLSLPWRATPVEEVLHGHDRRPTARTRAQEIVRRLRHALLSDTAASRLTARCAPEEAALAAPLAAKLGPRAAVAADPDMAPGRGDIQEGTT